MGLITKVLERVNQAVAGDLTTIETSENELFAPHQAGLGGDIVEAYQQLSITEKAMGGILLVGAGLAVAHRAKTRWGTASPMSTAAVRRLSDTAEEILRESKTGQPGDIIRDVDTYFRKVSTMADDTGVIGTINRRLGRSAVVADTKKLLHARFGYLTERVQGLVEYDLPVSRRRSAEEINFGNLNTLEDFYSLFGSRDFSGFEFDPSSMNRLMDRAEKVLTKNDLKLFKNELDLLFMKFIAQIKKEGFDAKKTADSQGRLGQYNVSIDMSQLDPQSMNDVVREPQSTLKEQRRRLFASGESTQEINIRIRALEDLESLNDIRAALQKRLSNASRESAR